MDNRKRRTIEISIPNKNICYHCYKENLEDSEKFCSNCGFPQNGTQLEQKKFILAFREKKTKLKKSVNAFKHARNMLFATSFLNFIVFYGWHIVSTFIGAIISLTYIALGIWANKKPFSAIYSGLIIFITTNSFFGLMFGPDFFLYNIAWILIIIVVMFLGIFAVKHSEKYKKEFEIIKSRNG